MAPVSHPVVSNRIKDKKETGADSEYCRSDIERHKAIFGFYNVASRGGAFSMLCGRIGRSVEAFPISIARKGTTRHKGHDLIHTTSEETSRAALGRHIQYTRC